MANYRWKEGFFGLHLTSSFCRHVVRSINKEIHHLSRVRRKIEEFPWKLGQIFLKISQIFPKINVKSFLPTTTCYLSVCLELIRNKYRENDEGGKSLSLSRRLGRKNSKRFFFSHVFFVLRQAKRKAWALIGRKTFFEDFHLIDSSRRFSFVDDEKLEAKLKLTWKERKKSFVVVVVVTDGRFWVIEFLWKKWSWRFEGFWK